MTVSQWMYGLLVVTLEPDRVAPAVLSSIDVVIAIGKEPAEMLNIFRKSVGESGIDGARRRERRREP